MAMSTTSEPRNWLDSTGWRHGSIGFGIHEIHEVPGRTPQARFFYFLALMVITGGQSST